MPFHFLEPEVSGGLGPRSVLDRSCHPPRVEKLHYVFEGWLGDELVESFPCWLVSERLVALLVAAELTGFSTSEAEVTVSPEFESLHPDSTLPRFLRFEVHGQPGIDDFSVAKDHRLVVSDRALATLHASGLQHALDEPYEA